MEKARATRLLSHLQWPCANHIERDVLKKRKKRKVTRFLHGLHNQQAVGEPTSADILLLHHSLRHCFNIQLTSVSPKECIFLYCTE